MHDGLGKLLLVDAEALTQADDGAMARFDDGICQVEEWMCGNLLRQDTQLITESLP